MKTLLVLLHLLSSAVLLHSAALPLVPVTCSEDSGAAAARMAMHHINAHHNHGYKFRLREIEGNKVEKVDDGCNIELQLDLQETKCHIVNPKHFEDCATRDVTERAVVANCTVMMSVKSGVSEVIKYECDTQQEKTNSEMMMICPDCPTLIPRDDPTILASIRQAVGEFNKKSTQKNYFVLHEVGRLLAAYIMSTGMNYYAEIVLEETHCPNGSRILIEACKPLCPDRAHHAFCQAHITNQKRTVTVDCEIYPPANMTELGPGVREPICRHHHHYDTRPCLTDHHGHGPPPHAHGQGPPPHAHGQGPPPHVHDHGQGPPPHAHGQGPPPHVHDHGQGPPPHVHDHGQGPLPDSGSEGHSVHGPPGTKRPQCHGLLANSDPALHPICPWPVPERHGHREHSHSDCRQS